MAGCAAEGYAITLHIVRSIFLWRGTAYQHWPAKSRRPLRELDLTLLFDNDFADLFEVRVNVARAAAWVRAGPWANRRRAGI